MCPVKNLEDDTEFFKKFSWREIDTGVHLGGMLATRSVPQKGLPAVFGAIRNDNDFPITANFYVGIDPKDIKDCSKDVTEIIESGKVWYNGYFVVMKDKKKNKIGTHKMGLYTELKNAKQKAKKAARIALAATIGIKVGKIHGISLELKVVGPNTYKCPECNVPLEHMPVKEGSPIRFWVCKSCKNHWTI